MRYLKLFEDFEPHDPYELMIIPPNKKAEMIIEEIRKREQNLNLVNDLIVLGANVDWQDYEIYNHTPLHMAAFYGRVKIVRMLIDAGADVNVQSEDGWTPLHVAAYKEELKIARMLIDAGANKDLQNDDDKLPYDLADTQELKNTLKL